MATPGSHSGWTLRTCRRGECILSVGAMSAGCTGLSLDDNSLTLIAELGLRWDYHVHLGQCPCMPQFACNGQFHAIA